MQPIKIATNVLHRLSRNQHTLHNFQNCFTSKQASVCELLRKTPCANTEITVKGWVRAVREHSDITFVNVSDGSCGSHLQVVIPSDRLPKNTTFGCCVEATGVLQVSQGKGQASEMAAKSLDIIGTCDPLARKQHTMEYTRQFPHLRARTISFGALLRLRSAATHAVHQFFQNEGYCNIHTPIITANDCEGAGEVFTVQPDAGVNTVMDGDGDADDSGLFFGVPTYLTVSGQLHLEATSAGLDKVYTFSPTFRAENARGRHHLNEFYMIEAEQAFTSTLEDLMQVIERLTKSVTESLLNGHQEDMTFFTNRLAPRGQKDRLEKIAYSEYIRMSYTEAVDILQNANKKFKFKPKWGNDLQKEHERHLVEHCGDVPVFVTDFPAAIKAFYARQNADPTTVACVDLLAPGVGEICGGSLREERYDVLKSKLDAGGDDKLDWYMDLRRFGTAPHGGFGIGFERYLQTILGIDNIKDTIPFPRSRNNCRT